MTGGVDMSVYLQKKLSTGFFGGEGFLMEQYSGNGYVWLEIHGAVEERTLAEGECLAVSSGFVAAMDATCTMEIETVKGLTNVVF